MARNSISPRFSIADIWCADSIPCGVRKGPLSWPTRTLTTTPILARRCIRSMTPRGATWKTGSFRRSGSRDSKGSVFTGPIFRESDPVYQGVKVPVAFYKVVAVVDDAKGQLGVTAFEMDQSRVMPPQPGAPIPKAPFDPGRFSLNQITLLELEERSGIDFGKLKDFDVLAAQPVPKSLLRGARLRLPMTGVREAVLWAP